MVKKSLQLITLFMVLIFFVSAGQGSGKFDRVTNTSKLTGVEINVNPNMTFISNPLVLEGAKSGGDFWFGPEISTQLSGYYDYQTNGENKHYIYRHSASILHTILMISTDSANQDPTRRCVTAFSTDDGSSWTYIVDIPENLRSGFCSMSAKTDGVPVIGNHYIPTGGVLTTGVHVDIAPGAGSFSHYVIPQNINYIWPGLARMSNNTNFLVAAETYQSGAATDSGVASIFNSTSNTFQNLKRFVSQATSQLNMRWTYAAGPNNNAIYVLDAITDAGGNLGLNRMFIFKTTDGGVSWDNGNVLFNPVVQGSDTLIPFWGLDAIYDASGNYYVAFNTTSPGRTFATAKLWVSKNGGTPALVAQHSGTNGIPEAANLVLNADAGICTIDHPALSLSADGSNIFVAFSVQYEADTLNGFNKCHIYYSFSPTGTLSFNPPIKITNSGPNSFDERYPSLTQTAPNLGGNFGTTCFLVYQKDPQPGNCAPGTINDGAPISRSTLIARKIYNADSPIGIKEIGNTVPKEFALYQNYPNPFNPVTKIRFDLPVSSNVTVTIYDAAGRLVSNIVNGQFLKAGTKELSFNAASLASGVYFYSINAGSFNQTRKMVLVK